MADENKALVRARGTALVPYPHPDPRSDDTRKKIGRAYKELEKGRWGWEPTGQPESLDKCVELARHIADGDLYAADQATASWAFAVTRVKVDFDPTFGLAADAAPASLKKSAPQSATKDGDK